MSFRSCNHLHFRTSPIAFDWFYICIISWLLDLEDGFYPAFTMAFLHRSSVMPFIARESWKDFIPAGDTRLQILIYSYNVLFDGPRKRLFSLHCRLPFARFLITILIVGTRCFCFSIIFPSSSSHTLPRYLLDSCLRRHVGFFPIFTSARCFSRLRNEGKYTTVVEEISHCRNTFLLVFYYFPIASSGHARTFVFGWKMHAFLFFFLLS